MAASTPQRSNRFAIAAPAAAMIAHLKMKARRRLGSNWSTAVNRKAPMRIIAEA
jgi:hypothetical protein